MLPNAIFKKKNTNPVFLSLCWYRKLAGSNPILDNPQTGSWQVVLIIMMLFLGINKTTDFNSMQR